MSCSILKNKEGVIETVLAPNGKTSKLYQDALVVTKDKEKALRLWAIGYTPSFNKWMSNLKPEVKQEVKEEVKPGVEELFETDSNLANQVYEALGFSNNTKTQIAQIKNNNLIITQYSDESFDVVPDKEGIAKKTQEIEQEYEEDLKLVDKIIKDFEEGKDVFNQNDNVSTIISNASREYDFNYSTELKSFVSEEFNGDEQFASGERQWNPKIYDKVFIRNGIEVGQSKIAKLKIVDKLKQGIEKKKKDALYYLEAWESQEGIDRTKKETKYYYDISEFDERGFYNKGLVKSKKGYTLRNLEGGALSSIPGSQGAIKGYGYYHNRIDRKQPDAHIFIDRIDETGVYIRYTTVQKEFQGKGIASIMLNRVRQDYPNLPVHRTLITNPIIVKQSANIQGATDIKGNPLPKFKNDKEIHEWLDNNDHIILPPLNNQITPQQKQQALQLYSQYLDSIFPDSKVKDIVYHGITSRLKEKFDKFSKEFIKSGQGRYGEDGFFFSENKEEINKNYNISGLITAIINLRNTSTDIYKNTWKETIEYLTEPQEIYGGKTDLDYLAEGYRAAAWNKEGNWKKQVEKLKEDGWKIEETPNSFIKLGKISSQEKTYYNHLKKNLEKRTLPFNVNNSVEAITKAKKQKLDGLIYENVLEESSVDKHNQYVVFEPEQIHILGSKQDIEGFKKFVGGKSKSKQTEVKSSPVQKTVILNNGNYLNLSEEKKKEIYENYVNLMDRKREGKAVDISKFDLVFNNLQVFNYKDTYIFGEWDVENNIFKGRLMSSSGIKELYGALDELFKTVDFVASVPEDIGKMLEKKGLYKLEVGKNYNFRGEEMIKNLYLSDEKLVRKIFKKATNAVTEEDVKKYDTFYNQYSTQAKFIDNYIPYSIKKEQQQNIKKDVSASALSEILSILDKDKIDFKTLYYVQLLSQKFSEYIKEQPQYESREELFKKISKEVDNIFIKIRESAISNKKFNYFENKNKELITDIEGAIKDKLSIYIPKIQVDDQNFYENLKELGIYDYNAFRLARKIKSGKVTEEDKSSFIKEIVKNSSLNKIAIDKTDIINDPKIYSKLDTELNKTLANYLSNFGITTEVLENFQDKFNTDSFATVDILNKIIYTSKNNQTDYPQQAGKLIAYMMQHNPLVTEVMKDLKKYSIYRSLSKDELLDTVGDLIAEQLYKKTNTDISKSLLDKLKMLIHQFFINLTTLKLNRINRNVGFIADNVLLQNQSLITSSIYKPGAQDKKTSQVNLEEALKNDKFGNDIVDKMADHFILTGSPSLSEQGTILRPIENHLHDLDWVSPYEKTKTEKLFNSLYPNNQFVREIKGENNDTKTWLIVPEGYKIINLEIIGDKNTVIGYDIVDENNNIVSSYDKKNDNHTGKIEAKLIDIFIYTNNKSRKEDSTGIPYILPSGKVLLLSDWRITFKAKLGYARLKDIWDYNRFVPYKSTSNLETFLDENGEPKLSTISSYVIANKKNSEPGVINDNSGVTFTTDNPLFNKCAQ